MTQAQQQALWNNLASGAESGMDFTSRWFADPQNITTIQTTSIIPTELNAYLYQMENNIAEFADMLGNATVASSFRGYAAARKTAMNTLMYNATAGQILVNRTVLRLSHQLQSSSGTSCDADVHTTAVHM